MLIQDRTALLAFLKNIESAPYVTMDTEFISEKTYHPQLCLVQVGYGSHAAVIDVLCDMDPGPLIEFLRNPRRLKVLHAGHQDIAILRHDYSLSLEPVFDTQIAAMVCGFGDQVSYAQLVKSLTKTELDKSSQIIDWSRRPLLQRHVDYALADVTSLIPVYERLRDEIETRGRGSWVEEEMRELSNPARYTFSAEAQVRKLKMRGLSARRHALLLELVSWREELAAARNIPRGWVLKDNALRDIASNPPDSLEELGHIRGIGGNAGNRTGRDLLKRLQVARANPVARKVAKTRDPNWNPGRENAIVLLRALLNHVCNQYDVSPGLVASKPELDQIAAGIKTRVNEGWRRKVFGEMAEQLVSGKIALALDSQGVKVVETSFDLA